jgi:hypothetical protein
METSMVKTLAAKHRSTVTTMARKHKAAIGTPHGPRTCFQASIDSEGIQRGHSATGVVLDDRQPPRSPSAARN